MLHASQVEEEGGGRCGRVAMMARATVSETKESLPNYIHVHDVVRVNDEGEGETYDGKKQS